MIEISKIVDNEKVNTKLDVDALKRKLPATEKNISIILVATKTPRKSDRWVKEGREYIRLILDYNKVLYSTHTFVMNYLVRESLPLIKA